MTRRDSGAIGLEKVGIALIAGLVIAAIVLTVSPTTIGNNMRIAICNIFAGSGETCSPEELDPHLPTEPCVMSEDGWGGSVNVAAGVNAGSDMQVVTEQLSDGTYRVTVTRGSNIGVEVGVGWDARAEINGSSYGLDASAGAEANLEGGQSEVYVVSSAEEAAEIEEWAIVDQAVAATAGGNPITGFFQDWLSDQISDVLGMTPPTPTATTYYGGLSAEASAHLTTWLMFGADAEVGLGTTLGYTQYADGTTEVVTAIEGTAQISGNVATVNGQLGGTGTMYTEETYDAQGNLSGMTLNFTTEGDEGSSITSYHLPTTTQAEREAAMRIMWDPFYFDDFMEMSMQQGQVNRTNYTDDGWDGGFVVGGKFLAEVGVEVGAEGISSNIESAEYWDGSQWVSWPDCS